MKVSKKVIIFIIVIAVVAVALYFYMRPRIMGNTKKLYDGVSVTGVQPFVEFRMNAGFDKFEGQIGSEDAEVKAFHGKNYDFYAENSEDKRSVKLSIVSRKTGQNIVEKIIYYV